MKLRLIERNDGKYQYQTSYQFGNETRWESCNHMLFGTEKDAREFILEIHKFIIGHEVKRVLDEVEL